MILAQVVGINEDLKLNIKFGAGSSEYFFYFILKFLTKYNVNNKYFVPEMGC